MFCFSFSWADLLHGNCLLTGFNFPIKIFLAKRTFLFWILLCYLLNMLSFCLVVFLGVVLLFRYSAALLLFHYSVVFLLFRQRSSVPPAFRCSVSVSVFHRCSVFRCSWFYSMPSSLDRSMASTKPMNIYMGVGVTAFPITCHLKKQ